MYMQWECFVRLVSDMQYYGMSTATWWYMIYSNIINLFIWRLSYGLQDNCHRSWLVFIDAWYENLCTVLCHLIICTPFSHLGPILNCYNHDEVSLVPCILVFLMLCGTVCKFCLIKFTCILALFSFVVIPIYLIVKLNSKI